MSSSRRRPEPRLSISLGRDVREKPTTPSMGKCFLLTSPFIEQLLKVLGNAIQMIDDDSEVLGEAVKSH